MMRGLEIAVDDGGGYGRQRRNGRQGGRGRAGRWGQSIFSILMREIFHILQEFIE
jgi:hypothetical protein